MDVSRPLSPALLPRSLLSCLPLLWTRVLFPGGPAGPARARVGALLWLLLLPGVLLYPWRSFHLLEPDEGRYAQIPREMLARGDWVVPTLQGQPYLDKPPLLYWLVMLAYQLGGVSEASARLVPALAVHATILLLYLIGRRGVGERPAFWGALLLALSPVFVGVGRLLIMDGLLAFLVALALLAGFEAVRGQRFRLGWWLLAAVACGLGGLAKGPVAGLLVLPPLWLHGRLTHAPSRFGWRAAAAFVALALAVNLPWYLAMCRREPAFAAHFLWEHNVVRFLSPFDHLKPVWFYVPVLLAGLLPALPPAVALLRSLLLGGDGAVRRTPEMGFWLLAGGWCVLFFSLSGCKLPTYILPAFPPLALALGAFVAAGRWSASRIWHGGLAAAALLLGLGNGWLLPWYAAQRSPVGRPEVLASYCADPTVPVVCYPRNCDSAAFYLGRDDLPSFRSKHASDLASSLAERPRTVVLFTHRHSLDALRHALPPGVRVTRHTSLHRDAGAAPSLLDRLAGDTPWGLCDVALIERVE